MALTLAPLLIDAGIDLAHALVIRHAYVQIHEDSGSPGIHADSTSAEILEYTGNQSANPRKFPAVPPLYWIVFVPEGGDRARLWSVVKNRGELMNDGEHRLFDLAESEHMADLRGRLVVGWRSPRTWWMRATTAASYPIAEIADARPIPFPGYNWLVLNYAQLQAVMRDHRYTAWRTALAAVIGIYLITDTSDGRHYVGKADGAESILQRWHSYAINGHGGNVRLRGRDPKTFQFSLLRVFDPSTVKQAINAAEEHFKLALDTRTHGLNGI